MTPSLPAPVLVIGARSDIGRAIARRYAEAGCAVILAARNASSLAADCADLQTRYGVTAAVAECDVTATDPDAFFADLPEAPAVIVMVAGLLGDQAQSAAASAPASQVMRTNYVGPALFLLAGARRLAGRPGGGCIVGVSSVAGDRGRGSNFVYGSAKAGFTAFLSGLRNDLAKKGVHVLTVKPGFVDTAMTADMKLPAPLTAQPEEVAKAILAAHRRGRDVIYVRPIWWLIMLIIRTIPERIFKRLNL